MKRKKMLRLASALITLLLCAAVAYINYSRSAALSATLDEIPDYQGAPYVVLYDNQPDFTEDDLTTKAFESYSPLDLLGRCGTAYANVCQELMPTEDRDSIGQIKPSGWQTVRYDDLVDGSYLYNRCHLIGFQLTGENANEENLITGTRYMNVDGMLPFEDLVADYVQETGNHVLYRVTPIYDGSDLVASGVQMEAMSVEDKGRGVCFNVYVYNVQPGIEIDYTTGNSWLSGATVTDSNESASNGESSDEQQFTYTLNIKSKKFHDPGCSGAAGIIAENRDTYSGSRKELIEQGYSPCGQCQP